MNPNAKRMMIFICILASLVIACLGLETQANNHLGWVLLFAGVGCCSVGSIYLAVSSHRSVHRVNIQDRALWMLVPGFLVIFLAPPLEFLYLPANLPRVDFMQDVGLILFATGLLLCIWSFCLLEWWFLKGQQDKTSDLHTRGEAYQSIRYPVYMGFGLMAIGLGLGYSSLIGLLAIPVFLLPGLIYLVKVESSRLRNIKT